MTTHFLIADKSLVKAILRRPLGHLFPKTQLRFPISGLSEREYYQWGSELKSPYGKAGDEIWIREDWRAPAALNNVASRKIERGVQIMYDATHDNEERPWGKVREAEFMPRWASRLTLSVLNSRIERLHDISEDDARREGCPPAFLREVDVGCGRATYKNGFERAWNAQHGRRSWLQNPFVWTLEFTPIVTHGLAVEIKGEFITAEAP